MEIKIRELCKSYGKKKALQNFDATFENGIYGILGPNGAGKSTLMNILTDNLLRDSGRILCGGKDILKWGAAYRKSLGYMPQQQQLYETFTVTEFLAYMGTLKGMKKKEIRARMELLFPLLNLDKVKRKKIKELSGGMKQRVLLLQALLNDPKERIRIRNLISDLSQDRIVLIATHVVSDIEFISKEILLMKNGRLIDKASPEQLQAKIQGKVFEMSVGQQELEEVKEKFEISNLFRKDGQIIVRVVTQKRPEGYDEIREAAPTLEDVYLYEFEVKGAMHNNAVRKIAGT